MWDFWLFAGVLRGVLGKVGGGTWFFDGKNVVESWRNVVGKLLLCGAKKHATFLNFIFVWVLDWFAGGRGKADFSTPLRSGRDDVLMFIAIIF